MNIIKNNNTIWEYENLNYLLLIILGKSNNNLRCSNVCFAVSVVLMFSQLPLHPNQRAHGVVTISKSPVLVLLCHVYGPEPEVSPSRALNEAHENVLFFTFHWGRNWGGWPGQSCTWWWSRWDLGYASGSRESPFLGNNLCFELVICQVDNPCSDSVLTARLPAFPVSVLPLTRWPFFQF